MRFAMLFPMLVCTSVTAETDIHRCLLEDGTIAFQETPCPEPAEDPDDSIEAETPPAEDELPQPTLPEPLSQDRAECEKTTRDAIDAIDLEMRENAYTREQGRDYLAQLLALTEQLRACKQL